MALRRISESQKLQNDAETMPLRETARATAAEDRLATEAAIRTSLEEQLQSLRFSHDLLSRESSLPTSRHTPYVNRNEQLPTDLPTNFDDTSSHPANASF